MDYDDSYSKYLEVYGKIIEMNLLYITMVIFLVLLKLILLIHLNLKKK